MTTPKEKAEELVWSLGDAIWDSNGTSAGAIKCALIACDEIIIELFNSQDGVENKIRLEYWQEVKNELQKM